VLPESFLACPAPSDACSLSRRGSSSRRDRVSGCGWKDDLSHPIEWIERIVLNKKMGVVQCKPLQTLISSWRYIIYVSGTEF
jgi:hypothetical protein